MLYDPIYKHWFRAEWEGLEHVPREGGALLIANHAAAIPSDAPVIMHGIETELRRPVYGLAEYLFRALPVVGTLWARSGGVPAHPDNAYRLLHDDQQLALVFPEGAKGTGKLFRDRYKLHRFGRGGFVEIAMRSGVPIVPIAVVGAEESMPILFKSRRLAALLNIPYFPITANMLAFGPAGLGIYLPAKFRLRVLPPVHFDVHPDQERYPRALVMEEAEKIREQRPGGPLRHAAHPPQRLVRLSACPACASSSPGSAPSGAAGSRSSSSRSTASRRSSASTATSRRLPLERTEFVRADSNYSILERIVRATKVDTILHTHLIVDSTEISGRGAPRDQRHRHDEPARRGGRRRKPGAQGHREELDAHVRRQLQGPVLLPRVDAAHARRRAPEWSGRCSTRRRSCGTSRSTTRT